MARLKRYLLAVILVWISSFICANVIHIIRRNNSTNKTSNPTFVKEAAVRQSTEFANNQPRKMAADALLGDNTANNSRTEQKGTETPFKNLHPDVNIVSSTPVKDKDTAPEDCVPLPKSPKRGTVICLNKVADDIWVSGALKKKKLWEEDLIFNMHKVLEMDTNMVLLDLGSNIGEYTLWAAAMGREVLAVEMLESNVRLLQWSLWLSGLAHMVTIVNNAVFRDHSTLSVNFLKGNIGGSRLNTSSAHAPLKLKHALVKVRTICLDDLLPLLEGKSVFIKMDIENSEHDALMCAHRLFNGTNVKVVQMEWMNKASNEEDQINNFMSQHGYVVSESALEYKQLNRKLGDVYFLKKSEFSGA